MKIAILGNGGREHAIATKISKSPKLQKLYCIPGNAGTELIAKNVEIDFYNYESLLQFIKENKIDFFGNLASTTTIPAQIIKKYECDLVPIYIERLEKYNFKMYVSQPIVINAEKSQEEISKHLNKILEKMILKNPDQWIWTHNRWKK